MGSTAIWSPEWGSDDTGSVAELLGNAADEWLRQNGRPATYSASDAPYLYAAESIFWSKAGPLVAPSGFLDEFRVLVAGPGVPDGRAVVYRHWSGTALLYVGFSQHFKARQRGHRSASPWWESITRITVESFATAVEALDAEAAAIATEEPLFNIAGRLQ